MAVKGKVYLVGAGPGDPELITLRAKSLLEKAEVVLYDALVHPNLLKYCPSSCKLIGVGKRKGKHSEKQSSINQKMLDYAKEGLVVIRLKGGDPLIFGRGGEEMQFLSKNNITFEVIPGITSAIAVPTYAGIALTHRNLSRSVAFVTGTLKKGEVQLDIPIADTLVFLMAVTNLEEIIDQILKIDRFSKETPAALIYQGTLADEKVIHGTLSSIVQEKDKYEVITPAIFVVGDVVGIAEQFNWRKELPLKGKRVVILREKEQAKDYIEKLSGLGAEVLGIPMLKIIPIKKEQKKLTKKLLEAKDMIIFTSSNGVNCFLETLKKQKVDLRVLSHINIIAIGPKTAEQLERAGLVADFIPKQYDVDGILNDLPEQLRGSNILLPLAEKARDALEVGLQLRGANTTRVNLYSTEKPQIEIIPIHDNDHIIFTSPSTVENFFESNLFNNQDINVYSIGDQTSLKLSEFFTGNVITAKTPTLDSIIELLIASKD